MRNLKVKISHSIFMISGILAWGYLSLTLIELFGLNVSQSDSLPAATNVIVFLAAIISFVVFTLIANLLSYVFMARVLMVPRRVLQQVIAERTASDPRENILIVQKFYKWCLDKAYKQK